MPNILHNITTKIDHSIKADFLQFMQRDYIPHLMESGVFESYRFCRLLGVDESDGLTYALQLVLASRPAFDVYQETQAYGHQKMFEERFKGQLVVFRSVLEEVEA